MGCVGKDEYSEILESKARGEGVNVQYQYTEKESTGNVNCEVITTLIICNKSLIDLSGTCL